MNKEQESKDYPKAKAIFSITEEENLEPIEGDMRKILTENMIQELKELREKDSIMTRLHKCKCGSKRVDILIKSGKGDSPTLHRVSCLDCETLTLNYEDINEVIYVWNILSSDAKNQYEYEQYEKDESNNDNYLKMVGWAFLHHSQYDN